MWNQPIALKDADFILLQKSRHPALTRTELHILALVERGLKSREIAKLFGCSTRNIENHRYRIGKKMRVEKTNRT